MTDARAHPQASPDADHVEALTMAEAEHLFATLPEPGPTELTGVLRARVVAIPVVQRLPRRLRARVLGVVNPVLAVVYRGKRFTGSEGVNVWWGQRNWAHFRLHPSAADRAVRIDYDLDGNPKPVRAIVSHVRVLSAHRYLCVMTVRRRASALVLLYFTLEAAR